MSLAQFRPVYHTESGSHLIDGWYVNNVPTDVARMLAPFAIAVNVSAPVNKNV